MTPRLRLLADDERLRRIISDWLHSYVMRPHEQLGRPGAVCPFVTQALATDQVWMAACTLGPEPDLDTMSQALEQAAVSFRDLTGTPGEGSLASLIVAFEDLGREHWHLIDEGHSSTKTRFVSTGLMLGQFHPRCEAGAAHNPDFPVNRAPVPIIVIRNMAVHDILFLADKPAWVKAFTAWLDRCGGRLRHPVYRRRLEEALGRGTR
jgi:heptaprenyl diphosphate synthase